MIAPRLNRYLAACGYGSRRACEQLILEGRVSINGHFVRDLATRVGPGDDVRVTGLPARKPGATIVIALHKPRGLITTRKDERGRAALPSLLPPQYHNLAYIGRLDRDSEGLLLLTNSGALADALARPKNKIEKEYLVTLREPPDPAKIPKLLRGFPIAAGRARMDRVHIVGEHTLSIVLTQGLKRQIREMLHRVGAEVTRLIRVRIGTVTLNDLPPGHWRKLSPSEISTLESLARTLPTPPAPPAAS